MQQDYNCIYCVVDMHAITVRQDPKALRENTAKAYALGLACGIDPDKSIFYIQSHVPAHSELAWILGCFTPYGELGRMTQFKDKSELYSDNINAGLFTYPVLMAADILLYQSDIVPVGADQRQHLELARNIAIRFNGVYGDVFRVPEPFIPKTGARIMSLTDPAKKMSKSDPAPKSFISVLDPRDTIIKKFKSAVTDSEAEVVYREGKDGVNNLMNIYSIVAGKDNAETEREFAGRGYGDFKIAVGEAVADYLAPIQQKYYELMANPGDLERYWKSGAQRADMVAKRTMGKVLKKLGMTER
jgi:tryptophanyl-tRNA synthetase